METLYFLIPIALAFCVLTLALVLWAIQSGQYEDLDKEAQSLFVEPDEELSDDTN